jgi:hypothetical protein
MIRPRTTWLWFLTALALFAYIALLRPPGRKPALAPERVIADFAPEMVREIQVAPQGITVVRSNGGWWMSQPLAYPADGDQINLLLASLKALAPATVIQESELAEGRAGANAGFGFSPPQASLVFLSGERKCQVLVGKRTLPGDQAYVRVSGASGVFIVDAGWLKSAPGPTNSWRSTSLLEAPAFEVTRIAVTNRPNIFVLEADETNRLWYMLYPTASARADSDRVEQSLMQLQGARIAEFVSDEPRADLDALGLNPPEFELGLSKGSNLLELLQFGKSPTNDTNLVYARSAGRATVFTVSGNVLAPWKATAKDFRDPRLIPSAAETELVEVWGQDHFVLERQAGGGWRLDGAGFPLDAASVRELVGGLSELKAQQIVIDLILEKALPEYGLAQPARRYRMRLAIPGAREGVTNRSDVEIQFGGISGGKVYARRKDEASVYAVGLTNLGMLPDASWQLRRRQLWTFDTNAVSGVAIEQRGQVRKLIHRGHYQWSLAPGSEGAIDNLLVEETVCELARMSAADWVARGAQAPERFGIKPDSYRVTLELKDSPAVSVAFGKLAPSGNIYASVSFEGEPWVMEFPAWLYNYVLANLSIPESP